MHVKNSGKVNPTVMSLDVGMRGCGRVVFHEGEIAACGTIATEPDKRKTVR
jgi:hypothetical protein